MILLSTYMKPFLTMLTTGVCIFPATDPLHHLNIEMEVGIDIHTVVYTQRSANYSTFSVSAFIIQHSLSDPSTHILGPKKQLIRTTKSNPVSHNVIRTDGDYRDSWLETKNKGSTEERQKKTIRKSLSEKLSNIRVNKAKKRADMRSSGYN